MEIGALVLCILSAIFSSLIAYTVYLIFTYLNKKALGMQTLTDEMVKDSIYVMVLQEAMSTIVFKFILGFTIPIGHSLAVLFTSLLQFVALLTIWQFNMIFWMRYLNVFHQAFLNNFDERLIKRATRCTVGLVSTISILIMMGNIKNTIMYQVMTDGDLIHLMNPIAISMIICLIAIIGIQFKIEVFKKMVDAKGLKTAQGSSIKNQPRGHSCGRRYALNSSQLESGEDLDQGGISQHVRQLKTYRIEIIMLAFGFFINIFLWYLIPNDNLYEKLLKGFVFRQFMQLAITLICIKRNEKMFLFCKDQVLAHFCCSTEIIADLNAGTETNENENLDQNEDDEDDSYQGGPSGTAQVQVIQVQPKDSSKNDQEDKIEQPIS